MAIGACTNCELRWRLSGRLGRRFATGTVKCSLCGGVLHRLRTSSAPPDAPVSLIFDRGASPESIRFEAECVLARPSGLFPVMNRRARRTLELLDQYECR